MLASRGLIITLIATIGLVGCDQQCEKGYKIKKEYSTIFWHESWHENSKDTLLDGAIRTETWSYKDGRVLTVRCFQSAKQGGLPQVQQYDIRYSINAPLLVRVVPELQKSGAIEIVVSIDGVAVGSLTTKVVAQKGSIDFLTPVDPQLVDKLEAAKKTVVVMPRQLGEKLDDLIEFGVAKLAENIKPVKEACRAIDEKREPAPAKPKQEIKKT